MQCFTWSEYLSKFGYKPDLKYKLSKPVGEKGYGSTKHNDKENAHSLTYRILYPHCLEKQWRQIKLNYAPYQRFFPNFVM